jgi:hypothetical protein
MEGMFQTNQYKKPACEYKNEQERGARRTLMPESLSSLLAGSPME